MKTFRINGLRAGFLILLTAMVFNTGWAQSIKQDKHAKKLADIKSLVLSNNYVFKAEFAQTYHGGDRYLTSEYDFRVGKDSLIAYLPYFGRAYVAPLNNEDAGMMFTATHFDYKVTEKKNGWDVAIKPKDAKDVQVMYIYIDKEGYATLNITSTNRDPITYQGYVTAKKQKV